MRALARAGAGARRPSCSALHHGLFCVGCCWALMLLMFAFGAGSLGWMLLLAAVMAIEKNVPLGPAPERAARAWRCWPGRCVLVASHV